MNISEVKKLGTLSLINFAGKHADRCAAHADAAVQGRAAAVRQAALDAQHAYSAYRPLRALWSDATKEKERLDVAVENQIREVSYELLSPKLCNKDRKDARYRVLFPSGNVAFIDGSDRAQGAHVHGMVKVLNETPDHPMADRAASLDAANEAFLASLAPQVAAESAFRAAESLMSDKREALYRVLRKSVTFLRDLLDGDEAAVERLFPTVAEAHVDEPNEPDA